MTDEKRAARIDKRQTEPDVPDPNPWDISPQTEHEAWAYRDAERFLEAQVKRLRETRPSLAEVELALCQSLRAEFEFEMAKVQGRNWGVFVYTFSAVRPVKGEFGLRPVRGALFDGHPIIVSAASRAEADATAEAGLQDTVLFARAACTALLEGRPEDIDGTNDGLEIAYSPRERAH